MTHAQTGVASAVRRPHEDWSGLASAAQRRQLQNRINARAYRQRRKPPKRKSASGRNPPRDVIISFDCSVSSLSCTLPAFSSPTPPPSDISPNLEFQAWKDAQQLADFILHMDDPKATPFLTRLRKVLATKTEYITRHPPSPSTDLLLTVVSMNVLRAFCRNLKILGFDYIALTQGEAISPFVTNPVRITRSLPTDLRPTALQRTILHHPVYDIFPDPLLREQILLCRGSYDKNALCWDLVGWPSNERGDRDGLLVWGEPYRSDSWEVTESFLGRHPALLPGCRNLIASSNKWRIARGEPPLRIRELQ